MSLLAKKSLISMKSFSACVLMATFQGNPTSTVISADAPTGSAMAKEMKNFYSDLHAALDSVSLHNILFVLGDFKGRLGSDEVPYSYHEKSNRDGEYLFDLMKEYTLIAGNTKFQKPKRKFWTWLCPPSHRHPSS